MGFRLLIFFEETFWFIISKQFQVVNNFLNLKQVKQWFPDYVVTVKPMKYEARINPSLQELLLDPDFFNLSQSEQEHILRHERRHIKNGSSKGEDFLCGIVNW